MKIEKLPKHVLFALKEDEKTEKEIQTMSVYEVFDFFLKYEGIIGYTSSIMNTYDKIKEASE